MHASTLKLVIVVAEASETENNNKNNKQNNKQNKEQNKKQSSTTHNKTAITDIFAAIKKKENVLFNDALDTFYYSAYIASDIFR